MRRALAVSLTVLAACHDDWHDVLAKCVAEGRCTNPGGGSGGGSGTGGGAGGGMALKGVVLEWLPDSGTTFGPVEPNVPFTRAFDLRNIGDTRTGRISVLVSGGAAFSTTQCQSGNPLGSLDQCASPVVVTFNAPDVGAFSTVLTASEDSAAGADASVMLSGTAAWGPIALTVLTNGGTGQGVVTVTADDGGTALCDGGCVLTYPRHSHLALVATPVQSEFLGWSGACSAAGPCTVDLVDDGGYSVTAAFDAWPQLKVDIQPVAIGPHDVHITALDGGLDCQTPCALPLPPGSTYELNAEGTAFALFSSWSGCGAATGTRCSGSIGASDLTVTANFNGVNRAFVSSTKLAMNLGPTQYDMQCGSQAQNAGLGGQTWHALIAIGSGAPQDQFINKSGWLRVDGKPFTQDLLAPTNAVYYPLTLDAMGNDRSVSGPLVVATGMDGGNCGNWSQTIGNVTAGVATAAAGKLWANSDTSHSCSETMPIYCLQADFAAAVQPPPIPDGGRLAFLSNGLVGPTSPPDPLCASEADGGFLALRSDDMIAATTRFALDAGTWYRPDGVQLLPSAAALVTSGPFALQAPISQTSYSAYQTLPRNVWTGSHWPSQPGDMTSTCGAWSGTGTSAVVGNAVESSPAWFDNGALGCTSSAHVYCFQR